MNAKTLNTTEPRKPNAAIDCGAISRYGHQSGSVFRRLLRRGFTLAEMLIVLLILGVLATVAVQSMQPVMDQARFEATQRTLENIRAAIVGPKGLTDGVSGFVADVGQLPTNLSQLYTNPNNDPNWNGPYLRLPIGSDVFVDGWGNEIKVESDSDKLYLIPKGRNGNAEYWPSQVNDPVYPVDPKKTPEPFLQRREWQADSVAVNIVDTNSAASSPSSFLVAIFKNGVEIRKEENVTSLATFGPSPDDNLAVGHRTVKVLKDGTTTEQSREIILLPGTSHVITFYFK